MLKGFKEFILKGNVVELATAVIIAAAFTAIVTAFTEKIIQPLINAIPIGSDQFNGLGFCLTTCTPGQTENSTFIDIGAVITATINFLIVAAVVYFLIVVPYNKLSAMYGTAEEVAEEKEITLLTEIRNILDPEAKAKDEAAAKAKDDVVPPATTAFDGPDFNKRPDFDSGPLGRGPQPPAGAPQQGFPPADGPSVQPSRDLGGPPSGAIPLQTQRIQTGPAVQPSQPPAGPPPAAPPGGGYAPPNPAPGPGQGGYPPPQGGYPQQGQGNVPPSNYPPSGGFPAQGDPDGPGRHSR